LKLDLKILLLVVFLFTVVKNYAQHRSQMSVELNTKDKTLTIEQELEFYNETGDTLTSIVLNDWNNAFSSKISPLAKRFSDEFYRGFHLANEDERGGSRFLNISKSDKSVLSFVRTIKNPDYIEVKLNEKVAPNNKITLYLSYVEKIPSDKFTKYGINENGSMNLKNWFLSPSRYENHSFVKNSNNNLDDIANSVSDYTINLKIPKNLDLITDLNSTQIYESEKNAIYKLNGKNRTDFSLFIQPKSNFKTYKNNSVDVITDLKNKNLTENQKIAVIERVTEFVNDLIGKYPHEKITVAESDYERNPFYGLNQLPTFISPFSEEFVYEIKFLKTYVNNYLKTSLRLDPRKDNWIYDGIQVYTMMKYIDEKHPDSKMFGRLSKLSLFKNYNLAKLGFNEQYRYFYILMARKNIDQPLGYPKNALIKFNEQIASKYRAGLSLKFLSDYLGDNLVDKSIHQFYEANKIKQQNRTSFENSLKTNTPKNINWFFKTIIDSRETIDYKFNKVLKTTDSIIFSIKNKTNIFVPMPVYGIKKGEVVFKKWIETTKNDTVFTFERKNADKIVLNYENEVPEYNLRNNWRKIEGFFPNDRPIKFVFMKDLEDPYYNQILYVPSLTYNFYDGVSIGMRLLNKTILDKPFIFDVNPAYSTKSGSMSGSASFIINENYRHSTLFNARYSINGSFFHYAPDATYLKITPTIQLRIREENFRDNRKQLFLFRQVIVNREKSLFIQDNTNQNYSVFDAKYFNTRMEVINNVNFIADLQLSSRFGKVSAELEYRKLYENNHQINLRMYIGSFLYNRTNSDFFSFALDRPTDYLFDYNYIGRSESTGLLSQQFIMSEGGFKSKINTPFANQWISTVNTSYSVWNWVELYGDLGIIKNKNQKEKFVFDSGIRLNLVSDYFELYFPIYSNNGWEVTQTKYPDKIRFIITLNPKNLLNLFTRKWF
jgi:phenylpyruvate tautomerase PptA (4-oxalocrotonate tautomerase family)